MDLMMHNRDWHRKPTANIFEPTSQFVLWAETLRNFDTDLVQSSSKKICSDVIKYVLINEMLIVGPYTYHYK